MRLWKNGVFFIYFSLSILGEWNLLVMSSRPEAKQEKQPSFAIGWEKLQPCDKNENVLRFIAVFPSLSTIHFAVK